MTFCITDGRDAFQLDLRREGGQEPRLRSQADSLLYKVISCGLLCSGSNCIKRVRDHRQTGTDEQKDMEKFNVYERKFAWGADYQHSFSPSTYLSFYFGPLGSLARQGEQDVARFLLQCLHETYSSGENHKSSNPELIER